MASAPTVKRDVVAVRTVRRSFHVALLDLACGHRVARVVLDGRAYRPRNLWCEVCSDAASAQIGLTTPAARPYTASLPLPLGHRIPRKARGRAGGKWFAPRRDRERRRR